MTPKEKPTREYLAFRPEPEMARAMQRLHVRDGIGFSEQIRRALDAWLPAKKIGYTRKKEKS